MHGGLGSAFCLLLDICVPKGQLFSSNNAFQPRLLAEVPHGLVGDPKQIFLGFAITKTN